jgi:hypothetical protein
MNNADLILLSIVLLQSAVVVYLFLSRSKFASISAELGSRFIGMSLRLGASTLENQALRTHLEQIEVSHCAETAHLVGTILDYKNIGEMAFTRAKAAEGEVAALSVRCEDWQLKVSGLKYWIFWLQAELAKAKSVNAKERVIKLFLNLVAKLAHPGA